MRWLFNAVLSAPDTRILMQLLIMLTQTPGHPADGCASWHRGGMGAEPGTAAHSTLPLARHEARLSIGPASCAACLNSP